MDFGYGSTPTQQPQQSGGGGWGLNPLTDIMKATSSLGSWFDQHTKIGSFNPGIGSLVSSAANILPGLAEGAVTVGQAAVGNENAADRLSQMGGGILHGVQDTLTDVASAGGLAPNPLSSAIGGTSLREYATQGGQGLGGGLFNDAMNALIVADGVGAAAKTGALGDAASKVAQFGEEAAKGAVDVGLPAGARLEEAKLTGRDVRATQLAEHSALSTGGDPATIKQAILNRLNTIENIQGVRDKLSLPLEPWRLGTSLGRAATERLGGTAAPLEEARPAEGPTGASEGNPQPVQNAPVQQPSMVPVSDLTPGNELRHQITPGSPDEPLVVQRFGDEQRVVEGNHRLEAAIQNGDTHVPVIYENAPDQLAGLEGMLKTAEKPEVNPEAFISEDAKRYAEEHGLPEPKPVNLTAKVDPLRGNMIAKLYKLAESRPDDPAVVKAYTAFARDTVRQWDYLKSKGVDVQFQDRGEGPGVYANADEMINDVRNNNRLVVDRTGPDEQHLMPQMSNVIDHDAAGNPITVNDAFRAVHDYFGHYDAGNDFGRHGEDVAWRLHAPMFSSEAQPALFTETVGQNSFLNFAPENVALKRIGQNPSFPDQKATLLPELVRQPDWRPAGPEIAAKMASSLPRIEGVPRYYETLIGRSEPVPRWAQAVVARLPEPLVQLLAWTDNARLAHAEKVISRQTIRAIAVEARRIENTPEITALKQQAQQLIIDRVPGATPGVASDIIGERVRAAITLGPEWHNLEALRPGIESVAPGLTDHVLGFQNDVPEEYNTPEFRQAIEQLADPIRRMRVAAQQQLANSTFLGNRGLENADLTEPIMTAQERRWAAQIKQFVNEATDLETKGVQKDLNDVTRQILDATDVRAKALRDAQIAAEAGEAALQQINRARSYLPWAFQSDARFAQMADDVAGKIIEDGGATFDPHTAGGRFLEMRDPDLAGYVVGGVKGSAVQIPLEEFLRVNPDTGRLQGSEAVEAMTRTFQNAYQFPDMMVGGWVEGDTVHLDPSQFLEGMTARDRALLLGAARQQLSITELHTGDFLPTDWMDPNIAAHFVGKGTYAARDARALELRRISDTQAANGERALSQDDIDKAMAWTDLQAVRASQLHPDQFPTPDAYYRQAFRSEYAERGVNGDFVLNEVRPMIRDTKVLKGVVRDVIARQAPESQWYYQAHDFIEPHGDALERETGPVQLGMGTPWSAPKEVSPKELLYNFVAVMSMNTDPAQNWMWALGGVRNWVNVSRSAMRELTDAVNEWVKLDQGKRTPIDNGAELPKLVQLLSEDTNQLARRYYLAILDGHTIESWDADFFRPGGAFENYGNVTDRPLSERNLKQEMIDRMGGNREQAIMELHGSKAAAKIRSFYDNLRYPKTSMLVTNDSWMARLFGERDTWWGNVERWHTYANKVRDIASDLSKETGRTVMPHEVQAALWFWTKQHYADINAAAVRGMGAEALRAVANGSWSRTTDPLGQFWAQAEDYSRTLNTEGKGKGVVTPTTMPMLRQPLEPETVEPGAEIPPTEPTEVQYRNPRAKTSKGKVVPTDEGNSITLGRLEYDDVMDKVDAALKAGKEDEARYAIWNYIKQSDADWEERKQGLQFWDAPSRPSWEPFSQTLSDLFGTHVMSGPLFEMFGDELLGQFVASPGPNTPAMIRLFQGGDFTTLLHEHGHLLRSMLTDDEVAQLEQHYDVRRDAWSRQAEENFVHDMLASAVGFEGDSPVKGVLDHLRANIAEHYQAFGETFNAAGLHPEVANFWGHVLAPELDQIAAPGVDIGGTTLIGHEGELPDESNLTPAQKVARTPKMPVDESVTQTYQRGRQGQEALDKWRQSQIRKQEGVAAAQRAQKSIEALTKQINERMLPSQVAAAGLREKIADLSDKLAEGLEDPSRARTPTVFQPMVEAGKRLAEAVELYPELEPIVTGLPKTFGEAFDYAADHGFDPVHMPDMTPDRVRQLVNGTIRLGGEPGKQFVAGGRKLRSGALRAADLEDQSIEAIIAGLVEATKEERTNMIVDWVDRVAAKDIPRQGEVGPRLLPNKQWVPWDPIRRGMLAAENQKGEVQALGATKMIPRSVANAIREYGTMGSNPFARAMQTATDPWRFFMLTLNPAFYLRHFTGHVMLAAASETGGFHLSDWVKAFHSARAKFTDLPEVTGLNITQAELGQPGVVTYPSIGDALAQGGKRAALSYLSDAIHKSVGVSDSFARAVVYYSDIRAGRTPMEAMQHAMDALVDYGNLSDTERYFARSLIPFYGFQKGVLKAASRLPVDHPLMSALMLKVGQWQGETAKDANGNPLPEYYQGVVDLPFVGKVNLRSFSPFKDLGSLTTPDGVVSSLQYAVQAVVRSGLGVPAPGTQANGVKVDRFGRLAPDVNVGTQLLGTVLGSPQGNLLEGLAGQGPKTPAQTVAGFFGLPVATDQTVNNAGARNTISQAEVANASQAQQQQAVQSPVDANALQNNLSQAVKGGTQAAPQQATPGNTPANQQQIQAALTAATDKQQAAAKAKKAKTGGGGSHKPHKPTNGRRLSNKPRTHRTGTHRSGGRVQVGSRAGAGKSVFKVSSKTKAALRQAFGKSQNAASRHGGR